MPLDTNGHRLNLKIVPGIQIPDQNYHQESYQLETPFSDCMGAQAVSNKILKSLDQIKHEYGFN